MKPNHNFIYYSIMIIIIISLIIILYFYNIKFKKIEKFKYEYLPKNWNINYNEYPETNNSLKKYNHFKEIPNNLIIRTPFTINKYGQQNYNAYFFANNYIYPLY